MKNNRTHHNTRSRLDQLLAEGFEIISRYPLLITRGTRALTVLPNGVISEVGK